MRRLHQFCKISGGLHFSISCLIGAWLKPIFDFSDVSAQFYWFLFTGLCYNATYERLLSANVWSIWSVAGLTANAFKLHNYNHNPTINNYTQSVVLYILYKSGLHYTGESWKLHLKKIHITLERCIICKWVKLFNISCWSELDNAFTIEWRKEKEALVVRLLNVIGLFFKYSPTLNQWMYYCVAVEPLSADGVTAYGFEVRGWYQDYFE